jgi:hypothetical protein
MLGFDDFLLILGATTLANLAVEVGAEIIAEWWVHAPPGSSPLEPGTVDPSAASEPIRYAPELLTQISAKVDQTAVWSERTADSLGAQVSERLSAKFDQAAAWSGEVMDKLSVKADALSVKAAETALWSEQMIGTLTTSLGLQ